MIENRTNLQLSLLQKFILIQAARHGIMTAKAISIMSNGKWAYRTVCSQVRYLRKKGLLEKAKADEVILSAFELHQGIDVETLGLGPKSHFKVHRRARSHALELATLFSIWARHSNMIEVHSELEFERGFFSNLGLDRIPDGCIVSRNGLNDEISVVELEYSFKSRSQVAEVLDAYKACFDTHSVFDRVILVVHDSSTLIWYRRLISDWPESNQKKVILLDSISTNHDLENVLGQKCDDPISVLMNFDNRCRHIAQEKWSKYAFSFLCKKNDSQNTPQSDGVDVSKE